MLTVEELEAASDNSLYAKQPKLGIEGPDLLLKGTVYPFGYALEVKTNSEEVLRQYGELWGKFTMRRETTPIPVEVQVAESESTECPPLPAYRLMRPFLTAVADRDNYAVSDLERTTSRITVSEAALRHPRYAQYYLLGAPAVCVTTRYVTAIHAGCVSIGGRGVMLCGESGAGKTTISWACARAGWTYTSDDGCFLENGEAGRVVTGDCYRVRFRPSAIELFPELQGAELTPRAGGKPSIELPTDPMAHVTRSQTGRIDVIVFLNRWGMGAPELVPFSKDIARLYMAQTLFGPPEIAAIQQKTIENLLELDVHELRYSDLDSAIELLRKLLLDGR